MNARVAAQCVLPSNLLREGDGDLGVVASGRPASLALNLKTEFPLLVLGFSHPLPWDAIREFARVHERILVAEEPTPFIEARLHLCEDVFGKLILLIMLVLIWRGKLLEI